ncbi:hypothetical protein F2P56_031401 [Juglans regia]|uniref:Transcription factor TRY-like isoform X1 n=3 Tax=Juglans regia TaxID=51240 RepID=A0A2I4E040_JUGRE|nr:transcription factor TRY-like isoform X1 [Juglans regia]KAF5451106.1 hypothetical protein F2P56_031401 [Juglans regia]
MQLKPTSQRAYTYLQTLSRTYVPLSEKKPYMDRRRRKRANISSTFESEEVSSIEWEVIHMTEQEEDLFYRMYRLVGERWDLIAGRIPGRKPEEIERFWIMRHWEGVAAGRRKLHKKESPRSVFSL